MPKGPSVKRGLLIKSREAALNAIQTFNNPLATFKTETFIVLMSIAWTYLLHAYYHANHIDYRYYHRQGLRRKFDRTPSGAFRYWDLSQCLTAEECPLDSPTIQNLRFLIGLRNEIEHHQSTGVDDALTGRYLACCLNYERMITTFFGERYSLGDRISYALQLKSMVPAADIDGASQLPSNVAHYLSEFDDEIDENDYLHPHFAYRVIFTRKHTNNRGSADRAIEFVDDNSELGQHIKEYWVTKEVERPKYIPSRIVEMMRSEGYSLFNMRHHTQLWQAKQARKPGRGYGVQVEYQWYWYERWVEEVRRHCHENRENYT